MLLNNLKPTPVVLCYNGKYGRVLPLSLLIMKNSLQACFLGSLIFINYVYIFFKIVYWLECGWKKHVTGAQLF